jgi:hypothetical protein
LDLNFLIYYVTNYNRPEQNINMAVKKLLIFSVLLLAFSGAVLAGQTIIQKGNIVTDVFNVTALFAERISGHILKGDIDASGNKVINLAEPVNNQDAATKAYVDERIKKKGLPLSAYGSPFNSIEVFYGLGKTFLASDSKGNAILWVYKITFLQGNTANYLYKYSPSLKKTFSKDIGISNIGPAVGVFTDWNDNIYLLKGTASLTMRKFNSKGEEQEGIYPSIMSTQPFVVDYDNNLIISSLPPAKTSQCTFTKYSLASGQGDWRTGPTPVVTKILPCGRFDVDEDNNLYILNTTSLRKYGA